MEVTPRQRHSPRLAEDADKLIAEGITFWDAGEIPLLAALASDDHAELVVAALHVLRMNARARRFFSAALHVDCERAA